MRCTEPLRLLARKDASWRAVASVCAALALLAGCAAPPPARPPAPAPAPAVPPSVTPPTAGQAAEPAAPALRPIALPAPGAPRTARELRRQMAHRLVQAHPEASYLSRAPERLLAIPVLEIELNGDGSVRRIVVLRHPRTEGKATQLAIDAVHRAAPYGNVSHLPRPWKVVETFLFDDQLRFKPHTLDMQSSP